MKRNISFIKSALFAFGVICLFSFQSFGQNVVSGKIGEQGTSESVIGASVVIEGTTTGTVTDVNGNFKLESARPFPWNLVISSVGYTTVKQAVNSATSNLTVSLKPEAAMLENIVVSASRKAEKVQDAPASVSVISPKTLQAASSAIDPVRELMNVPGVQIQQQSASRMNIEMRGASSLFSTSVFPILDYRSLVGPGIGTFQSDAAGLNSLDLNRIEVVRGPASALYGPGVTSGVVHFMSKSAIDFPGVAIELMGGTMNTKGISTRMAAASKNKKFGVKVNAHYKRGDEFTLDPNNVDDAKQIAKFKTSIVSPIVNASGVVAASQTGAQVLMTKSQLDPDGDGNMMSDHWQNASVNSTVEYRPFSDTKIIGSGGYNQAHSVFYNSQGEGLFQQTEYWGQVRVQKRGLFAQMFYVNNDGGTDKKPSFLYQTGNRTPVGRKQLEGQVQYNFGSKFLNGNYTVGADYRNAVSDTKHMVYGRNEDDDDYTIYGAYGQGKFELTKKLDLVVATRLDKFNFINKSALSPRVAFVYKADKNHTFRASYNRSNTAPAALILNIDFPVATPASGLFDVWLRGNKSGQSFGTNPMIDFTAPGIPNMPYGTPGLPLAVPYGAVTPAVLTGLSTALPASIFPLVQQILTNAANAPAGVTGTFTGYNLFTQQPLAPIDAPTARLQVDNTFEVGYSGKFFDKLTVGWDIYRMASTGQTNFTAISPTIRYTPDANMPTTLGTTVGTTVTTQLQAALIASGMPAAQAAGTAAAIGKAVGGAYTTAGTAFANQVKPLGAIFGAVETDKVPVDGMVHNAAGYRTFKEIVFYGSDFALGYQFTKDLSGFANYSWLSKVNWDATDLNEDANSGLTYAMNVPKSKYRMGLVYSPTVGVRGNVSFQHDDSFLVSFGQYSGQTDTKNLVDAGIGYKIKQGVSVDFTCTNLFDSKYRAFVNMPKIGRRAIIKLTYSF